MSLKSERKRCIKAEKQAQAVAEYARWDWYPTAAELKLPDVPEHARESVRSFLTPFVGKILVKNCDCWNIAQQLMLKANSPRVGYVEGVWTRESHHLEHLRSECDCEENYETPSPHAWNTVDGHLVNLMTELKIRDWTPEWNEPLDDWKHEPFKEYTLEEFNKHIAEFGEPDGLSITVPIAERWADEFGLFTEDDRERIRTSELTLEDVVFKSAAKRLAARLLKAMAA